MPDQASEPEDPLNTPGDPDGPPSSGRSTGEVGDQVRRLRRIEGQVRGLQRMVESGSPCLDVLTQIAAVTRALQAVALAQLDEHVRAGVVAARKATDPADADAELRQISAAIARLVRS